MGKRLAKFPSRFKPKWLATPALKTIFREISLAGGEARVAGGAVRNTLMKLPPGDIDIATTLAPEAVTKVFSSKGYLVIPTGLKHGTVTVKVNEHLFEVTTLRKDLATDGRHAQVAFTSDWEADAARRDFTMNAMYLAETGMLYDYHGGYLDVQRGMIRFVGKPEQRIREDHLRILRFFRFHAIYASGRMNRAALDACMSFRKLLRKLSSERIRSEMFKLLEAPGAVPVLKVMAKSGILQIVFPAPTFRRDYDWKTLSELPHDALLRLSLFVADVSAAQNALRLSNKEAERISSIQDAPSVTPKLSLRERRSMIYLIGADIFRDAVHLSRAKSETLQEEKGWISLLRFAAKWQKPRFPLSGRDLIQRGIEPGPRTGELLRKLEDWWIASDFKESPEELLKRI
jgi:poly(A) polymerase